MSRLFLIALFALVLVLLLASDAIWRLTPYQVRTDTGSK